MPLVHLFTTNVEVLSKEDFLTFAKEITQLDNVILPQSIPFSSTPCSQMSFVFITELQTSYSVFLN